MILSQLTLFENEKWNEISKNNNFLVENSSLVLAFGSKTLLANQSNFEYLKNQYPNASIILASTSGEIIQDKVSDNTIVATALSFEKTKVKAIETQISKHENSFDAGVFLAKSLDSENLACILIFSDGIQVNGGELVQGLNKLNINQVPITGGLAGDGSNFSSTLTGLNKLPTEGNIIAVGLYSQDLKIGHGSLGGWDEFGTERTVTKSEKNILIELDNKNALDLYKEYLGPYSNELPASALLFPLSIKLKDGSNLVRTILTIDEENKKMTFAGNIPEGSKVRLMKANFDKLIEASSTAAQKCIEISQKANSQYALLVSCVGRKLILQERTDEEVESAIEIFGKNCVVSGFYSYGEISPLNEKAICELHNQTMTITTFTEV